MTISNDTEHPTICNLCGGKVILLQVDKKYSRTGFIYKCLECGASVGTHMSDVSKALGPLADMEQKKLRREVHVWFDKLWKNHEEREVWYHKLAAELGMTLEQCHFAKMSVEELNKALEIIKKWWFKKYDI